MSPGAALRREYRRCVEREALRGRAGACADAALAAAVRARLRREPALLPALHGDAAALLAAGLRGRRELGPALRRLAAAFELLELAAVNLYLFPWRRELGTVKTFSGAYVHGLRGALPEAELARSFARLGYARRDEHHLALARPPPAPQLAAAACGFFACRLECELLAEAVLRLRPRRLHATQLLHARRLAGGLDACVEALRRGGPARLCRPLPCPPAAEEPPRRDARTGEPPQEPLCCNANEDVYREPPCCDAACTGKPLQELPQRDADEEPLQELPQQDVDEDSLQELLQCDADEDLYREPPHRDAAEHPYPDPLRHDARSPDPYQELPLCAPGLHLYQELPCPGAATEDLYQELPHCDTARGAAPYQEAPTSPGDTSLDTGTFPDGEGPVPLPALGAWRLRRDPRGAQDMPVRGQDVEPGQELLPAKGTAAPDASLLPGDCSDAADTPLSPPCSPPAPSHAPELPRYQLHSCLGRGTLPSYCCSTCQQLHAGACAALPACRSRHRGQELLGERQRRLWLQRSEVDRLLAHGAGPKP
ncbi:spermatogenesis-associated protein 2-like protein [Eudromia elegans]